MLILRPDFRTIPLSSDEKKMSKGLVNLWLNFASKDKAIFNKFEIEKSTNGEVKCLEIFSPTKVEMKTLNESFGRVKFWREIEKSFDSKITDEL